MSQARRTSATHRSRPAPGPAVLSLAAGMAAGATLAVIARLASVLPPALRSVLTVAPIPDPGFDAGWGAELVMPAQLQARDLDRLVTLVGAGIALVLTVTAVNLTVVAATRTVARRPEMAVRHALGPTRWRLLGPLLVEGVLLLLLGGALAALLVGAALPWFVAAGPLELAAVRPDLVLAAAGIGGPVLLTLLLATLPALDVWTLPSWSRLVTGERATTGAGAKTFTDLVLAGQVAVAVGVLFGSTLLLRSARVDATEAATDAVVVPITLDGTAASVDAVLDTARGLPGVASAGLASLGAVRGVGPMDRVITECHCAMGTLYAPLWAETPVHHAVSAGFFDTLGLAVEGAGFTDDDASAPVVVVSRVFVNGGSLGTEPLDRSVQPARFGEWYRVGGIVDDGRRVGIGAGAAPRPALYLPARLHPPREAVLAVRGDGITPVAVRDALRASLPGMTFGEAETVGTVLDRFAEPVRWLGGLLAVLGVLAAGLAGYGAFAMARGIVEGRHGEIGIRLALGGRPLRVAGSVLAGILARILAGTLFGLAATASVAHGLDVLDPAALGVVAVTLAGLVAAGAIPPLLGVLRADPARLLRSL